MAQRIEIDRGNVSLSMAADLSYLTTTLWVSCTPETALAMRDLLDDALDAWACLQRKPASPEVVVQELGSDLAGLAKHEG